MTQARIQIERFAGALAATGGLKLWSVIVTVLGDMSANGAAEVSGLALTGIVERIGLQPQAMRVALHRLKRDGWVETRREGRVVFYRLTKDGMSRSDAVRTRIYGGVTPLADPIKLAVLPTGEGNVLASLPDDILALSIAPRAILVCGKPALLPDDWLLAPVTPSALPGWVRSELEQAACEGEFQAFGDALALLRPQDVKTEGDRNVLRILVLHGWRRLVLRSDPLAETLLGAGSAVNVCRTQVHQLLTDLTRPSQIKVRE